MYQIKSIQPLVTQVAFLTVFVLSVLSLPASAFQPLITDNTGTQASGGKQLELSLNETREKVSGNLERLSALPMVYTHGLTETLEVFAGFSYAGLRSDSQSGDASGGGNPILGAKWRLYENEESKSSFAVKPEVIFPVSADREGAGLGAGKTSGHLTLILTQDVPFGAINMNAGLGRDRYRDTLTYPDTTTTRASIAPVWDITDQ